MPSVLLAIVFFCGISESSNPAFPLLTLSWIVLSIVYYLELSPVDPLLRPTYFQLGLCDGLYTSCIQPINRDVIDGYKTNESPRRSPDLPRDAL